MSNLFTGRYRKHLLKQEKLEAVDMYDYVLKLSCRLKELFNIEEVASSTNAKIIRTFSDVDSFLNTLSDFSNRSLGGLLTKEQFSEEYDKYAAEIEAKEEAVSAHLDTLIASGTALSEDAQLLKKRTHMDKGDVVDHIKSHAAKSAWRKNRLKYKAAIKKFHKSTAGKQFHRNLNRFNKSRVQSETFSADDVLQVSKGLSSMITHLLIEIQNTSTEKAEAVMPKVTEEDVAYRELVTLFNGLLEAMFNAYYTKDKETIVDVLSVIDEYYAIAEGEDAAA